MSKPVGSGSTPTQEQSTVRNTLEKEKSHAVNEPLSDVALREFCDKHYNQLLPLMAERVHQEKLRQVQTHLDFDNEEEKTENLGNEPRTLGPNPWEKEKTDRDSGLAQVSDPDPLTTHTPEVFFPDSAAERSKYPKKIVSKRGIPVQSFSHVWGKNKTSGRCSGTRTEMCSHG